MPDVTLLEMKDGARIYVEDKGCGKPIVLVHGWSCSAKFWKRNVPELAKAFRVITVDLRGHGHSSKILTGHTIRQYAQDIREVIEGLNLRDAALLGWSMGGPVVLSYYEQFRHDSRLEGFGLVDTAPHPFSPEPWNSHALHNHNINAMINALKLYAADPLKYATTFTRNMFKNADSVTAADLEWITAEMTQTPPWIAVAIYSDYLTGNYAGVLPQIGLPAIVFAADSGVYAKGIGMGRHIAGLIPQATFVPFEKAGHLLFYEQPEMFNRALAEFVQAL